MRPIAAILLLAPLMAGCAGTDASCTPSMPTRGDATPFCVVSDGWVIQGLEWRANSSTLVVLTHGLNEDHGPYLPLIDDLDGLHVVAFDSRGHGQSRLGTDGQRRLLTEADLLGLPHDLEAVAQGRRIDALVGASIGANSALLYADAHRPDARLVLLSAGLDYHGLRPRDANHALRGPALFIAAKGDTYAAQSSQLLSDEHAGDHTFRLIEGSAHGTNLLHDNATRAEIVDWLTQPRP